MVHPTTTAAATTTTGAPQEENAQGYALRVERGIELGAVILILMTLATGWLWLPQAAQGWTFPFTVLAIYTVHAAVVSAMSVTGHPGRRQAMRVLCLWAPVLAWCIVLRGPTDWGPAARGSPSSASL